MVRLGALMVAGAVLVGAAMPAFAQTAGPARYQMTPTAKGYVRLDTQTGEVAFCTEKGVGGGACTLAADDRKALEAEIDRLNVENARLKQQAGLAPKAAPHSETNDKIDRFYNFARDGTRRALDLAQDLWDKWNKDEPKPF